ncbi:MAG: hypothetical protein HYZ40_11755 [Rhodospirillales bacterium]|nr:hypothetical protein [Rhodospirillales bacterium]
MRALLAVADAIERMLRAIADWSGWLMVVLMVVICFDILSRKMGFQIPSRCGSATVTSSTSIPASTR